MVASTFRFLAAVFFILAVQRISAADKTFPVTIRIHADKSVGEWKPVWRFFGADEPNYATWPNGEKLLGELGALATNRVYFRTHNLLTSGNGTPALKWGSTGAYTEDARGNPIYNWTILDRIFEAYRAHGVQPYVEIGFMPEVLSIKPEPYQHHWGSKTNNNLFTGWAYPPKDYAKWSELVYQFVRHLRQRYGDAEVKTWLWEVWNEPDIGYWQGTREEFFKLYDFTVESVLRAYPGARIGGPDSTGPGSPKSADFLRAFLDHCAHEKNYATGKIGSRLDFISFHPKGFPKWQVDHVQMGISHQLTAIQEGFKIVASFPEWHDTPIILGESDPEGCAACSAQENPQNLYRNGPLYGSYTVEVLDNILALARREHVHFKGAVTWAFEFEGQPPFAGFRDLATDGVDKPVLNAFRLLGLLGNERLTVSSSGALPGEEIVQSGVRGHPDINALATRKQREIEVLVWNYHDDDLPSPDASIDLLITKLPPEVRHGLVEHFRVDSNHSNAFTAWRAMGSPQSISAAQLQGLESAGQLQLLTSPAWVDIDHGQLEMQFSLPRQGLSLIRLAW